MSTPKVAFYWCASCGGCEEAVVDLNEGVLTVADAVDIVLWPVAIDAKYSDIEAMEDGEIAVSFINGAIRLDEQQEIAELLRRKSQVVIAFGSCAHLGGIPGLANFKNREEILRRVYHEVPSMENPEGTEPQTETETNGHSLKLPGFWEEVKRLDEVVAVDYYLPGCPPMPDTIMDAVGAILEGKLPAPGAILSPGKNLCFECSRRESKPEMINIERIKRVFEVELAPDECFLARGVVCMGAATRSGCGEKCMLANMPCRGCYGPCDSVADQGAAFLSSLASIIDETDEARFERIISSFADVAGTVYRFSLPASLAHKGGLLKGGPSK